MTHDVDSDTTTFGLGDALARFAKSTPTAADLCDLAADLIDQRGWRRGEGDLEEPDGPVCVRDALREAVRQLGGVHTAAHQAEWAIEDEAQAVSPEWPRRWARIDLWNDLYAASEDDATKVLRAAAKKLRDRP